MFAKSKLSHRPLSLGAVQGHGPAAILSCKNKHTRDFVSPAQKTENKNCQAGRHEDGKVGRLARAEAPLRQIGLHVTNTPTKPTRPDTQHQRRPASELPQLPNDTGPSAVLRTSSSFCLASFLSLHVCAPHPLPNDTGPLADPHPACKRSFRCWLPSATTQYPPKAHLPR